VPERREGANNKRVKQRKNLMFWGKPAESEPRREGDRKDIKVQKKNVHKERGCKEGGKKQPEPHLNGDKKKSVCCRMVKRE